MNARTFLHAGPHYRKLAAIVVLSLAACRAGAEPPLLQSESAFVPLTTLQGLIKEITDAGKPEGRELDQVGKRLHLQCRQQPLPPNWVVDARKALFTWSCSVAWERKVRLISAELWLADNQQDIGGTTDGDLSSIKETLRQGLFGFFRLKPLPPATPTPQPEPAAPAKTSGHHPLPNAQAGTFA